MEPTQQFYHKMNEFLLVTRSKDEVEKKKRQLVRELKLKTVPTDSAIFMHLQQGSLVTKPTRTQSGVVPIAVMTSPAPCPHGKCTYCPGGVKSHFGDTPQSYTGHEPATLRALRHDYDAFAIVFNRLEQYVALGHDPTKVQLIIMGGTFTARPTEYQDTTMRDCYAAMNVFGKQFFAQGTIDKQRFREFFELPGDFKDEGRVKRVRERIRQLKRLTSVKQEIKENERAVIRCIGITIETRPDAVSHIEIQRLLDYGVTQVELGLQSMYDDVLQITKRGHTVDDVKRAIKLLRNAGVKITLHYMLGLPNTTPEQDIEGLKQLFTDENVRPDMLKVYPCSVAEGTELYKDWKQGTYTAITTDVAAQILAKWKPVVPPYCRIMRVVRDVPTKMFVAGVDRTNFRQHVHEKHNVTCRCIRCREPRGRTTSSDALTIHTLEYRASEGREYFIEAVDKKNDILYGFCRLRIVNNTAYVRELHVYGRVTALSKTGSVQHRGLGKKVLAKAENIVSQTNIKKLKILSGVGVRQYYEKLGYELQSPYMVKYIENIQ